MTTRPRVVSLFSGAGGMDLGFIEAGFDVVWAADACADAVATYRLNIGPNVHRQDVRTINPDHLPAGPPAGLRRGDRRPALPGVQRRRQDGPE